MRGIFHTDIDTANVNSSRELLLYSLYLIFFDIPGQFLRCWLIYFIIIIFYKKLPVYQKTFLTSNILLFLNSLKEKAELDYTGTSSIKLSTFKYRLS